MTFQVRRGFRYTRPMRRATVVLVEPPYVCWDRRLDRVREGEEEIPGIGTLVLGRANERRAMRNTVVWITKAELENIALRVLRQQPHCESVVSVSVQPARKVPRARRDPPDSSSPAFEARRSPSRG